MSNKHLLLTGGLGFIGGHFVEHYLKETDWNITVLDSLRQVGRVERLTTIKRYDPSRVQVFWHDLRAPIHKMLKNNIGDVDYIINMASDSHVDYSIEDPITFVHNNVMIALNMLEYAREVEPEKYIQISTDEVYGPAPEDYSHVETDILKPSNPYSSSKASQDAITYSFWRTYGVAAIIMRSMNNYGEKQDVSKMIPRTINHILHGTSMTIHAQPQTDGSWSPGSRVWLHCRNYADAVKFVLENVPIPRYGLDEGDLPIFNVGGEVELDNLELAETIADILDMPLHYDFVDFHDTRPGHDRRYSLDSTKIKEAGWTMPIPFRESLRRTVQWYEENPGWLE